MAGAHPPPCAPPSVHLPCPLLPTPTGIVKTSIGDHFGCRASLYYFLFAPIIKSPAQGAASSVFAATAPELAGQSGAYLEDCRMAKPWRVARDADKARQLWVKSEELVAAALQRRAKASVGAA